MRNGYTFVPATFETGTIQTSGGHIDGVVIRNNVQEFYTHHHPLPTINNLLSVLKTDIMSTIHQNLNKQETISVTQKKYEIKNDA